MGDSDSDKTTKKDHFHRRLRKIAALDSSSSSSSTSISQLPSISVSPSLSSSSPPFPQLYVAAAFGNSDDESDRDTEESLSMAAKLLISTEIEYTIDFLRLLPREISFHIISLLTVKDLLNCSEVHIHMFNVCLGYATE